MRYKIFILYIFALLSINSLYAQFAVQIEGVVRDSITDEVLASVTVAFPGTMVGTATDNNGHFTLNSTLDSTLLSVSYVGYNTKLIRLNKGRNKIVILLSPKEYDLAEVVVKPKKEKYKKKDNPAVIFARSVIAHRNEHEPEEHDYFSYNSYEQRTFAQNDFDMEKARNSFIYKHVDFILDYVDSTSVKGKTILPLYNEEIVTDKYYRKFPHTERSVIKASKRSGLIELLSADGVNQFIEEAFQDVNIFQDNVNLCLNRFVSPLSSIAINYYKYYLLDTLEIDGERCVDLGFAPFNSESFGFVGHLYVTLDSTFFIKKIDFSIPRDINLNYIGDMNITQDFERTAADSTRILKKNDIVVIFKLTKKMSGIYARRVALYRNHSFEKPDDEMVFREKSPVFDSEEAHSHSDEYWDNLHNEVQEVQPTSVEHMMAQLRQVPLFYWSEKTINILVNGYVQTHPKKEKSIFEIGPANTFISGNSLEGLRLRAGGNTTPNFSKHLFLDGYMAYGFDDQKWKGDALVEYSFNKKKSFRQEYPFHYLRAEYRYDINQLGQHYLYTNADNMFLMLKRRENNLITYIRKGELKYYQENYSGFGYSVALRHQTEWATKDVPFALKNSDGSLTPIDKYRTAEMEFYIRWAPNEKFYQSRNNRYPITLDAPIITLSHTIARKGILGSDYNYNRTELGMRKRFWISPFGYIDIYAQAGKIWDEVPYPLLFIPNANLSYTIQPESFMLLDPMEFMQDKYVSWEVSYYLNGWLFNRLPFIRELQLREVVAFRGWYGKLSDKNNPDVSDGIFVFPSNTYIMGNRPYMEMSVGLMNILKFLRVDYIWRLSYKEHKNVPNNGVRIQLKFTF